MKEVRERVKQKRNRHDARFEALTCHICAQVVAPAILGDGRRKVEFGFYLAHANSDVFDDVKHDMCD